MSILQLVKRQRRGGTRRLSNKDRRPASFLWAYVVCGALLPGTPVAHASDPGPESRSGLVRAYQQVRREFPTVDPRAAHTARISRLEAAVSSACAVLSEDGGGRLIASGLWPLKTTLVPNNSDGLYGFGWQLEHSRGRRNIPKYVLPVHAEDSGLFGFVVAEAAREDKQSTLVLPAIAVPAPKAWKAEFSIEMVRPSDRPSHDPFSDIRDYLVPPQPPPEYHPYYVEPSPRMRWITFRQLAERLPGILDASDAIPERVAEVLHRRPWQEEIEDAVPARSRFWYLLKSRLRWINPMRILRASSVPQLPSPAGLAPEMPPEHVRLLAQARSNLADLDEALHRWKKAFGDTSGAALEGPAGDFKRAYTLMLELLSADNRLPKDARRMLGHIDDVVGQLKMDPGRMLGALADDARTEYLSTVQQVLRTAADKTNDWARDSAQDRASMQLIGFQVALDQLQRD